MPESEFDKEILHKYQQIIGSLIHASNTLRFDVTYSVGVLSRLVTRVDKRILSYAYRVLNYLYTTKDFKLEFKKKKKGVKLNNKNGYPQLQAYVDADYAGDIESRKSTTGFIICLEEIPIYWRSKLQSTVASRTAEAEIIALYELSQELLYYKHVMDNLEINQRSINVYEDNQAAIAIMTRPDKQTKMRHLDTKYFKVQEMISDGTIKVNYVKSENNVSDLMTKSLPKATHLGILKNLGLWNHKI